MINKIFLMLCGLFTLLISATSQETISPFNGKNLDGWEITKIEDHGKVKVSDSCIILNKGNRITGINYLKEFPGTNYEVTLQAMRVEGSDFFCAMTFPVNGSFCTLVVGGWGGAVVGLSNIDGYDAANNFTAQVKFFTSGVWYNIRLRVTDKMIEAWIDNEKLVDFTIGYYRLSLRMEMEQSIPFGFATYNTIGSLRRIKVTTIPQ